MQPPNRPLEDIADLTDAMLDAYLELKEGELQRLRMTTHPIEFEMYYSL